MTLWLNSLSEVHVTVDRIKQKVEENRADIIQFMRDIVAIPSMDSQLKDVGERIAAEMQKLGFEEVRFDKMGNMLTASHAGGLVDSYTYDQLGQRTQHWNNQFGSSYKEYTDYDAQGRITKTVDYEGGTSGTITYAYAWNGALTTSGLATFGGWTKTTYQYGSAATESTDVFGRVIGRVDFGGGSAGTYSYTYNKAGWMTAQTSGAGVGLFGARNIAFVREFLINEGYTLANEDVGGAFARRLLFKPHSGRAFVKRLDSMAGAAVAREELDVVRKPLQCVAEIELF